MPTLDEVTPCQAAAAEVSRGDRAALVDGRRPIEEHDGHATLEHRLQAGVVLVDRGDQHALDALLHEDVEVVLLELGVVVAGADDQGGSERARFRVGTQRHVDEERDPEVDDHHAERPHPARPVPARTAPRRVAELFDRAVDPCARLRIDVGGPIEHVAHRAGRDPGARRATSWMVVTT